MGCSWTLKGLAMIFCGQENPIIIFRSKDIYICFKTNNKIPVNLLNEKKKKEKKRKHFFGKFHSLGHFNCVSDFLKF